MEKNEIAVFGGGCFWCTEAIFKNLKGVINVIPGYSGGSMKNPGYHEVATGTTGHAEVIKIEFDPSRIPYHDLLEIFFHTHNPTTPNRQGNDIGSQYRSIIFYTTKDQKTIAEKTISAIEKSHEFNSPLITEIQPLEQFYEAEYYHKNYYESHKDEPYCSYIISPKLQKLREKYSEKLK